MSSIISFASGRRIAAVPHHLATIVIRRRQGSWRRPPEANPPPVTIGRTQWDSFSEVAQGRVTTLTWLIIVRYWPGGLAGLVAACSAAVGLVRCWHLAC
jgi:hypothetical protein